MGTQINLLDTHPKFAALKRLPILFICENNLYSVYSRLSVRQPECREVFWLDKGHGVEAHQGDGNDVVEVFTLAERAIRKARRGGGPTFLELKTYCWREHCGPNYDNDLGYRTESEFQEWRRRCPVARLKEQLLKDDVLCNQGVASMEREMRTEVEDAFAFAKQSPFPEEHSLLEHIYAP